ncbi:hypothetical protein GCM10023144_44860 [Pigmentiphaga soli]|uniref:Uncharacterized protein n=1 Tax=Pigmentiphaga soli TaxID=1007095 RepID=A0ABP8HQB8_9BURK
MADKASGASVAARMAGPGAVAPDWDDTAAPNVPDVADAAGAGGRPAHPASAIRAHQAAARTGARQPGTGQDDERKNSGNRIGTRTSAAQANVGPACLEYRLAAAVRPFYRRCRSARRCAPV